MKDDEKQVLLDRIDVEVTPTTLIYIDGELISSEEGFMELKELQKKIDKYFK